MGGLHNLMERRLTDKHQRIAKPKAEEFILHNIIAERHSLPNAKDEGEAETFLRMK